jgi:hypothetical protein
MRAPAAAKDCASAAPMPEPAPVTIVTLSSIRMVTPQFRPICPRTRRSARCNLVEVERGSPTRTNVTVNSALFLTNSITAMPDTRPNLRSWSPGVATMGEGA